MNVFTNAYNKALSDGLTQHEASINTAQIYPFLLYVNRNNPEKRADISRQFKEYSYRK